MFLLNIEGTTTALGVCYLIRHDLKTTPRLPEAAFRSAGSALLRTGLAPGCGPRPVPPGHTQALTGKSSALSFHPASSKPFIIVAVRSLICFELVFASGVRKGPTSFSCVRMSGFPLVHGCAGELTPDHTSDQ